MDTRSLAKVPRTSYSIGHDEKRRFMGSFAPARELVRGTFANDRVSIRHQT
jgi:hypothetical protein